MATKKIKLGSREYDIPELAIRQRRVVVPLGIKLKTTMQRIRAEKSIESLTPEEYADIQEVVFQGCSRSDPKLQRDAFLDFVFDEIDLINAFAIVVRQAGFEERAEVMGEANGVVAPDYPTTDTGWESYFDSIVAQVCINTGWTPDYVEDNLITSIHKALNKQWEKCLPVSVAASLMCQYFKIWKPAGAGNDLAELANMGGIKNV